MTPNRLWIEQSSKEYLRSVGPVIMQGHAWQPQQHFLGELTRGHTVAPT